MSQQPEPSRMDVMLNLMPRSVPKPPTPGRQLAGRIVQRLGVALQGASRMLARDFNTHDRFTRPAQLHAALALVRHAPRLLPMLEHYPPVPHPDARFIPRCPVCDAEPGQHWAHDCPIVHRDARNHAVYDYRRKRILNYHVMDDPYMPLDPRDFRNATIPRCGVCGKGPGAHWPDSCPDNPIRDKMNGDQVVPPSEQVGTPESAQREWLRDTGVEPDELET